MEQSQRERESTSMSHTGNDKLPDSDDVYGAKTRTNCLLDIKRLTDSISVNGLLFTF